MRSFARCAQRVETVVIAGIYVSAFSDLPIGSLAGIRGYVKRAKRRGTSALIIAELARRQAKAAGATDVTLRTRRDDNVVRGTDGLDTFIESRMRATATGRPRLARP